MAGKLIPGESDKLVCWTHTTEQSASLMQALDQLNATYGPGTLHYGTRVEMAE